MKIIFLNTWRSELRDELRAYVKRHIADTAVFCFQEADSKNRYAYEDLLHDGYAVHDADRQEPDGGNHYGNVIYVRKDIPILEKSDIFTTRPGDFEVGLAAIVTVQVNNRTVTICNVHGVSQPGHKLDTPARLSQSQAILDSMAHHDAVIIGGDFNLLPETTSVKTFAQHGYRNLIAEYKVPTTRNRITLEHFPDTFQPFADYAFVSPAIGVSDFTVPDDVVSDHQPLEVTIAI